MLVVDTSFLTEKSFWNVGRRGREIDSQFNVLKLCEYARKILSRVPFFRDTRFFEWVLPLSLGAVVDGRSTESSRKKRDEDLSPPLSPPHPVRAASGGEENEEIAWSDARIRAAAATEGQAAFWNNVTPCPRELGNLSRPRKSCDRFPSIAILRPAVFLESVPFLTCRARPADTIPLMKCATVGVTLGQSLLKTLRFIPGSRSRSRFDKFQSTAVVPDFPPASLHLRCSFPRRRALR